MLAKIHTDKFDQIKKNIEESFEYNQKNYDRYNEFYKFVCVSTLSEDDINKLKVLNKPPITCNILEAMVINQIAEFQQQQPTPYVRDAEGVTPLQQTQTDMKQLIEDYLRHIVTTPSNDQLASKIMCDMAYGGFSSVKVYTEYANDMSFEQCIKYDRTFNPCLTFFDPMARASHKGDGDYCGEIVPFTKEKFMEEFPNVDINQFKFRNAGDLGSFHWAYKNEKREIILVANYYYKKQKPQKILLLSTGEVVTPEEYDRKILEWDLSGKIEQPPIVAKERMTTIQAICRYSLCQTQMIAHEETDYDMLPIIFADGNSVELQLNRGGNFEQVTRPYVYHAKGVQRLKDFAMQTAAAEIENMMMSKFTASIEGMPDDADYLDAYRNPQQASILLYKAYNDGNPEKPNPPPQVIQRTQTPSVVMEMFSAADTMTQMILGSYNLQEGLQPDISGKALLQGQTQANKGFTPYQLGYLRMLERVCEVIVSLIPKYYKTPRTLPTIRQDGRRDYVMINTVNAPYMNYDPKSLMIVIEPGPSVSAQRQIAMQQLTELAKILPSFAQFLDQEGGEVLIDNIDIKNGDNLKAMYTQWMQQQQQSNQQRQQQMQAMQQAQLQDIQTDVAEKQARVILDRKKLEDEQAQFVAKMLLEEDEKMRQFKIEAAKVVVSNKEADADVMMAAGKMQLAQTDQILEAERIDAEKSRTQVDAVATAMDIGIKLDKHLHDKEMDKRGLDIEEKKVNSAKSSAGTT